MLKLEPVTGHADHYGGRGSYTLYNGLRRLVLLRMQVGVVTTRINPFTAPCCKTSGLKDGLMRLQEFIFRSYRPSTFNAVRFDQNPFTLLVQKRRQKGLRVSNLALLMVVFKWHHGSEGVNQLVSHGWSMIMIIFMGAMSV